MLWLPVPSCVRPPAAQGYPPVPPHPELCAFLPPVRLISPRSSALCPVPSRDGCRKLKGGSIKAERGSTRTERGPSVNRFELGGRGLPAGCGVATGDTEGRRAEGEMGRAGWCSPMEQSRWLEFGSFSVSLFSSSESLCFFSAVSREEGGKSTFTCHQLRRMSGLFLVLRQWEGRTHTVTQEPKW